MEKPYFCHFLVPHSHRRSQHEARGDHCLLLIDFAHVASINRRCIAFQQLLSYCLNVLWSTLVKPSDEYVQQFYRILLLNNIVSDVLEELTLLQAAVFFHPPRPRLCLKPPLPQFATVSVLARPYSFCFGLATLLTLKLWCWQNATEIEREQ